MFWYLLSDCLQVSYVTRDFKVSTQMYPAMHCKAFITITITITSKTNLYGLDHVIPSFYIINFLILFNKL